MTDGPASENTYDHVMITVCHSAHNWIVGEDDKGNNKYERYFIEIPSQGLSRAPSEMVTHLLDSGWSILSAQAAGGGLDTGAYCFVNYVLRSPAK